METAERPRGDLRPRKAACGQAQGDGAERGPCAAQRRERGIPDGGAGPLTVGEALAMRSLRFRFRAGERFSMAAEMRRQSTTSLLARADAATVAALASSLCSRGLLRDEGGGEFSLTGGGQDG